MSSTTPAATGHLKNSDQRHHFHPFTDHKELAEKGGSRIITRADGVYIYDSDGNKILDGMAGLWCVNLGYGRQELVDAAAAQMQELPYYNNFFQCTHPPAIELSANSASSARTISTRCFSPDPVQRPMIHRCV